MLVFAEADDPPLDAQIDACKGKRAAFVDHDNVVILDSKKGSALRARFQPQNHAVVLVGLDGTANYRPDRPADPATPTALVGAMPMRIDELERRA